MTENQYFIKIKSFTEAKDKKRKSEKNKSVGNMKSKFLICPRDLFLINQKEK